MKNFLKYYWLEQEYLENEAQPFFKKNGYLTTEQFFAIVIWKRNASKTNVKRGLGNTDLDNKIKKLTSDVFHEQDNWKKIEILTKNRGIGIAIASAILTILYPERFTVYDYRVLEEINKQTKNKVRNIENLPKQKQATAYLRYCEQVESLAKANGLSLRDCDRAMWAESWYKDLREFLKKK